MLKLVTLPTDVLAAELQRCHPEWAADLRKCLEVFEQDEHV